MHLLKPLSLCCALVFAVTADGQNPNNQEKDQAKPPPAAKPKLKPLSELLSPSQSLVGLWHGKAAFGTDEFMTFTADGRLIIKHGAGEPVTFKYTLDTSTLPWKLDFSGVMQGVHGTIYTVFAFPAPDQFHMAPPSPEKEKRPDANALKASKLLLNRITLTKNEGLHQVLEVYLKKLAGTWEMQDGGATITVTLTADGAYTIKTPDSTDKGRFSINVSKSPLTIDLLSTEGAGVKYSIFSLTGEHADLRIGASGNTPETRPKTLDDPGARTLKRKAAPAQAK